MLSKHEDENKRSKRNQFLRQLVYIKYDVFVYPLLETLNLGLSRFGERQLDDNNYCLASAFNRKLSSQLAQFGANI